MNENPKDWSIDEHGVGHTQSAVSLITPGKMPMLTILVSEIGDDPPEMRKAKAFLRKIRRLLQE